MMGGNAPVASMPPTGSGRRAATVSVVIPAYNRRRFLPAALESVAHQTYPVCEIIVVDDGSTDGTVEVAQSAAQKDPKIRVLKRSHGGANRARNAGIAEAAGEWIAFLDSDDQFEPQKIDKQMRALDQYPSVVGVFTGLRHMDPDGERIFIPRDNPSLFDLRCSNVLSSTSSALIRSDVLKAIGGFDPDLESCQDWELWFRLRRAGPITVVQEPLVRLDTGPHARITNDLEKVSRGHQAVFDRLGSGVEGAYRKNVVKSMHRLVLADVFLRNGRSREALTQALSSFLGKPTPWATRVMFRAARQMCLKRSRSF